MKKTSRKATGRTAGRADRKDTAENGVRLRPSTSPFATEVVDEDGLHRIERLSIDLTQRWSRANTSEFKRAVEEETLGSTFDGAIRDAEKAWRAQPADANAPPLSEARYSAEIQSSINKIRLILTSNRNVVLTMTPQVSPTWSESEIRRKLPVALAKQVIRRIDSARRRPIRIPLEDLVVMVLNLGDQIRDGHWRFSFGGLARDGIRGNRQRKQASASASRDRRESAGRLRDILGRAVRAHRKSHPEDSNLTIARVLLRHPPPDFTPELINSSDRALAQRIYRLPK